jgi:hypothetical protein
VSIFVSYASGRKRTFADILNSAVSVSALLFALILMSWSGRGIAGDEAIAESGSDSNWEEVNQVLEIPQACTKDGVVMACEEYASRGPGDSSSTTDDDEDDESIETARPGRPNTFDEDSTSAVPVDKDSEWGTVSDYQNEAIASVPSGFAVVTGGFPNNNIPMLPPSAYPLPPMSSPLTPAARPPLSPGGPWMTPPSMTTWGRPAGSPMMPSSAFRMR